MIVPKIIPFSAMKAGDVGLGSGGNFFIKCDDTTICDLDSGKISAAVGPDTPITPLPGATLLV